MEYAEGYFKLEKIVDDNGTTLRSILENVEQQTGIRPGELDIGEVPLACEHIWEWFIELSSARHFMQHGPLSISYSEIKSWSELTGKNPNEYEVFYIRRLDDLYLRAKYANNN